jgi:hypothetical protein
VYQVSARGAAHGAMERENNVTCAKSGMLQRWTLGSKQPSLTQLVDRTCGICPAPSTYAGTRIISVHLDLT